MLGSLQFLLELFNLFFLLKHGLLRFLNALLKLFLAITLQFFNPLLEFLILRLIFLRQFHLYLSQLLLIVQLLIFVLDNLGVIVLQVLERLFGDMAVLRLGVLESLNLSLFLLVLFKKLLCVAHQFFYHALQFVVHLQRFHQLIRVVLRLLAHYLRRLGGRLGVLERRLLKLGLRVESRLEGGRCLRRVVEGCLGLVFVSCCFELV